MRKNVKLAIVRFFNAYGLKEYWMLLKYSNIFARTHSKPMLISAIDGRRKSQGLSDRFNGIISMYALSKATGSTFRILFTHPFYLTQFLVPNKYDWLPKDNELSSSIKDVRFKILRKQPKLSRLLKAFPLKKQIRVYANYNYLDEINHLYGKQYESGLLFHELFKPTNELDDLIQFHTGRIGTEYIACVFRFQSLLGDFLEYNNKSLPEEKQKLLIEKNKQALINLMENTNCPILVTSDSTKFISEIKNLNNIYTLPGKVVHLDCSSEEQKEVYMKSFIDLFMISHAKKVYSIGTNFMYPSSFPMFAAKINNVPFERLLID